MKALASALVLFLVGLTGIWLWNDATSSAAQETPGVVVVSAVDPQAALEAQRPDAPATTDAPPSASAQQPAVVDEVDEVVLAATVESLRGLFVGLRTGSETLAQGLHQAGADQAAAEQAAAEEAAAEEAAKEAAAEEAARQQQPAAVQPAPVQPGPSGPPGPCWEWDDDEWEYECDDEWEDYWDDYLDDLYDD